MEDLLWRIWSIKETSSLFTRVGEIQWSSVNCPHNRMVLFTIIVVVIIVVIVFKGRSIEQPELSTLSNGPVDPHARYHHHQWPFNGTAWTVQVSTQSNGPVDTHWREAQWQVLDGSVGSTTAFHEPNRQHPEIHWNRQVNVSRDFVPSATMKSSTPFHKFSVSPMSKSKNKLHKAENTPPPRPSVFSFHCWSWQSYLL